MSKIEKIENILKDEFPGAIIEAKDIAGDMENLHLGILIVSDLFEGKMLIDQHQMVMDALKESLKSDLHAVKIKTMTINKYNKSRS